MDASSRKVSVAYCNKLFLVERGEDTETLKSWHVHPVDSEKDCQLRLGYGVILPEQAAVLLDYGLIEILERTKPSCSTSYEEPTADNTVTHSQSRNDLKIREKAILICKGRKAKQLKKDRMGEGKGADAYRVTQKETESVEVTDEEVMVVYNELISKAKPEVEKPKIVKFEVGFADTPTVHDHRTATSLFPDCAWFLERKKVVHDLWRKGFHVTCGLRFGCHFLVYTRDPSLVHASFMVHCRGGTDSNWDALRRVSTQTKKTLVIARVAGDASVPEYSTLQRFTGLEDYSDDTVVTRATTVFNE